MQGCVSRLCLTPLCIFYINFLSLTASQSGSKSPIFLLSLLAEFYMDALNYTKFNKCLKPALKHEPSAGLREDGSPSQAETWRWPHRRGHPAPSSFILKNYRVIIIVITVIDQEGKLGEMYWYRVEPTFLLSVTGAKELTHTAAKELTHTADSHPDQQWRAVSCGGVVFNYLFKGKQIIISFH